MDTTNNNALIDSLMQIKSQIENKEHIVKSPLYKSFLPYDEEKVDIDFSKFSLG